MRNPEYNSPLLEVMRTHALAHTVSAFREKPIPENLAGMLHHSFTFAKDVMQLSAPLALCFSSNFAFQVRKSLDSERVPKNALRFVSGKLVGEINQIEQTYTTKGLPATQFMKAGMAANEIVQCILHAPDTTLPIAVTVAERIATYIATKVQPTIAAHMDQPSYAAVEADLAQRATIVLQSTADDLVTGRYTVEQEQKG